MHQVKKQMLSTKLYIYINIFAIVTVLRLITYAVHNFIINKKGETISIWHGLIQMF